MFSFTTHHALVSAGAFITWHVSVNLLFIVCVSYVCLRRGLLTLCAWDALRNVWSIYAWCLLMIRVCFAAFYVQYSQCWMSFMSRWRLDMRIPTAWERLLFNSFTTYSNTHTHTQLVNKHTDSFFPHFKNFIHGLKISMEYIKILCSLNKYCLIMISWREKKHLVSTMTMINIKVAFVVLKRFFFFKLVQ